MRLRVSGLVQGVGFRWFMREQARRLGLAGYVRNEPDGAVLVEVEGPPELVEKLKAAARRGPDAASVEGLETLATGIDPLPHPFAVQR